MKHNFMLATPLVSDDESPSLLSVLPGMVRILTFGRPGFWAQVRKVRLGNYVTELASALPSFSPQCTTMQFKITQTQRYCEYKFYPNNKFPVIQPARKIHSSFDQGMYTNKHKRKVLHSPDSGRHLVLVNRE